MSATPSQARGKSGNVRRDTRVTLGPLALTQFVASFATSNMNVSISNITRHLHTTVHGVQTAITLFQVCMAALMIPGSKLTDRWGRKRCLIGGLTVYGTGALFAAAAGRLWVLIAGYSLFEGVGSALMIPAIYILATLFYVDLASRAKAFGVITAMGGIGAAAGAPGRGADHDGVELALVVRAAGGDRRGDRRGRAAADGSGAARSTPALRPRRCAAVGRRHVAAHRRDPASRQRQPAVGDPPRRGRLFDSRVRATRGSEERAGKEPLLRSVRSATASPTWGS